MYRLKIITSTTRPGRKGIAIAKWITEFAKATDGLDVELLDLAEMNLPLMDEPNHPRLQQYQHEHTKRWSEKINEADGFIIVLGEYNFSFPAPIKNALDYLFMEWKYKPVGIVSYGGLSAGLRATQMLKPVITTLSMMPLTDQVAIPMFTKFINEDGIFEPDEMISKSAEALLKELQRWMGAMKTLR